MKYYLLAIVCMFSIACNKTYDGFRNKQEYEKAFERFNYFGYRLSKIWDDLDEEKYDYLNKICSEGELVGNQVDDSFMTDIRKALFIKNNIPMDSIEETKYYSELYPWYKASNKERKIVDPKEKAIIKQIEEYLFPKFYKLPNLKFVDFQNGIWQRDSFDIYDGYLESIFFDNGSFTIAKNQMNSGDRFRYLEGTYDIYEEFISFTPTKLLTIKEGTYILADINGLMQEFIGGKKFIQKFNGSILSYPILSFGKIVIPKKGEIYRLELFTDRPHYYYRLQDTVNE